MHTFEIWLVCPFEALAKKGTFTSCGKQKEIYVYRVNRPTKSGIGGPDYIAALIIIAIFAWWWAFNNWVNDGEAKRQFSELSGGKTVIIQRGDGRGNPFPHNVIYVLLVDGKTIYGRCDADMFKPTVCRLTEKLESP
ncbi:MAG: hypothetical protein HYT09_03580 [Candidatus Levybacteria bacterium]|nr:hypothetical protein [Candidatus Levybacteria bacterium]